MDQRSFFNLVNPSVQLKMLFILISALLFNAALLAGFLWYAIDLLLKNISQELIVASLTSELWFIGIVCSVSAIVVTVIFCYVLIRESNRVVGPIYRVKQELKTMHQTGEVTPISVRSEDHFQDMVKNLNLVLLDLANKQ